LLTFNRLNQSAHGFEACLFNSEAGNEVVNGRLFVDRRGAHFQSESLNEEIPADRVEVDWNKNDERVYVRDSARPELQIYTLDETILDHETLPQFAAVGNQIRSTLGNRELYRRLRLVGYFIVGFACIISFCSWAMGAMTRSLAKKVPTSWEQQFGESVFEELGGKESLTQHSNQAVQLAKLAEPLLKVVPLGDTKVKFFIVDDPDANACALPGGYIVVNTGLLEISERPEELLGVLAHELAHVTQRHYARKIISMSGPLVIFGVFLQTKNGVVNLLSEGSGMMIAQGFSQDYETEADDIGWKYLLAANIDPRGMISTFRKFKEQEGDAKQLTHAFDSHPALEKRIARLDKKSRKLRTQSGFLELPPITWANTNAFAMRVR
jgi:Zn-dependent protease with chaperone function